MRGVEVQRADIDAPWLRDGESFYVNGTERHGSDVSISTTITPPYEEVLNVRAGRIAMVREFLETVTPDMLASSRPNPHDSKYQESVLSCLHTILEEEWEHHRYAVRDLDAIETTSE